MKSKQYKLVIHGGCGNVIRGRFTEEQEKNYLETLNKSLEEGNNHLKNGGLSLEAVEAAIKILEDSPLFNAGKGSVFTHAGNHEMDASIMDGKTLEAGAVAGVTIIKNPVSAACKVMDHSTHVLLSGQGAEAFAREQDIETAEPSWFYDQTRWEQYQKALKKDQQFMDHTSDNEKFGTVGAVAIDQYGNLAASSSTGGITNKKHGRIGDSPLIGAGIYANNETCAVSCTGEGEYFICQVTAHTVSDLMEYRHESLEDAAHEALQDVKKIGGQGGLIAVDHLGNIAMPFITEGMFRGFVNQEREPFVAMYGPK